MPLSLDQIMANALGANATVSGESGYLTPIQMMGTAEGRNFIDQLTNTYMNNYNSGTAGYGLPGGAGGDANNLRGEIMQSFLNPSYNSSLYNWIQDQGEMPQIPTLSRTAIDNSYQLGQDTLANQMNIATGGWENNLALANIRSGDTRYSADQQLAAAMAAANASMYGADAAAGASRYGSDVQRHGIDVNAAVSRENMQMQRDLAANADKLARDLQAQGHQNALQLQALDEQLQRDLQQGLIDHQTAMQVSQHAHEQALQTERMTYQYAELEWQKQYGSDNLQILRDRIDLDRETSQWQKANDERRVGVEEGRLGLEKEQFGLYKALQEAQLRANPYSAVANALYTRGAGVPGGTTEYGQSTATLDNSGQLPFLQQLQQNGAIGQAGAPGGGTYINQGGIGGNEAPNPNKISQASYGNMNTAEKGITTSLAQYGGYDPNDYWNQMQRSWNTAGQKSQNFGGTRMM